MTATEDKKLAAVCGLYCRACSLYIGTHEDPARLEGIAARLGRTVAEVKCGGCRAAERSFYCRTCRIEACAAEKGLEFCGGCAQYPCELLKTFQGERPHRAELWRDQDRIGEVGWQAWLAEKKSYYTCPACGTVNSAYDRTCWRCGGEPSCRFVAEHRAAIDSFFAGQK